MSRKTKIDKINKLPDDEYFNAAFLVERWQDTLDLYVYVDFLYIEWDVDMLAGICVGQYPSDMNQEEYIDKYQHDSDFLDANSKITVSGKQVNDFECKYFFLDASQKQSIPDWEYWRAFPFLELYELILLSMEIDPRIDQKVFGINNDEYVIVIDKKGLREAWLKESGRYIEYIEKLDIAIANLKCNGGEIISAESPTSFDHSSLKVNVESFVTVVTGDNVNWNLHSKFPRMPKKPENEIEILANSNHEKDNSKLNILGNPELQKKLIREEIERRGIPFDAIPKGEKSSLQRYFYNNYQLSKDTFNDRWKEMDDIKSEYKTIR